MEATWSGAIRTIIRMAQIGLSATTIALAVGLVEQATHKEEKPPTMLIGAIVVLCYTTLHSLFVEGFKRFTVALLDLIPLIALLILILVSGKPHWSLKCSTLPVLADSKTQTAKLLGSSNGGTTGVRIDYVDFIKAGMELCKGTKILLIMNIVLCVCFAISIVVSLVIGVLKKKGRIE